MLGRSGCLIYLMIVSYKELAWGYDELDPLTGFGNRRWGFVGVTLVGAMDTMYLMGFKEDLELMRNWVCLVIIDNHIG